MTLIKEVNDLRRELKISRSKIQDLETALAISRKNAATTTEAIVQALNVEKGMRIVIFFYDFNVYNTSLKNNDQ